MKITLEVTKIKTIVMCKVIGPSTEAVLLLIGSLADHSNFTWFPLYPVPFKHKQR